LAATEPTPPAECVTVKVFTHGHLSWHAHYDLVEPGILREEFVFRVPKTMRMRDFKKTHLLPALEIANMSNLRLHVFARGKSGALRPSQVVSNNKQLELGSLLTSYHEDGVILFAEKSCRTDAPFFPNQPEGVRLLFFKFFNPLVGTLQYLTSLDVGTSRDVALFSVEPSLRRLVGLLENERVLWFEEIGPGTVAGVNPKRSLTERGCRSGDVFVFQTVASSEVATIPEHYRLLKRASWSGLSRLTVARSASSPRVPARTPTSSCRRRWPSGCHATIATIPAACSSSTRRDRMRANRLCESCWDLFRAILFP
jgi:hypothetical protein